jgi:uncharacterized membrane protein
MDIDTPYLPDPDMSPGVGMSAGFDGAFGGFIVIFVIVAAVSIFIWLRNVSKVVESGNDPTTFETDLAIRAMKSQALAPAAAERAPKSTVERLAELEALLAAGTITPDEHAAARAKVLGDI